MGGGFTILCLVFIPYHYYIEANNVKYYPLYISNISSGLAFYSCGYLFKDYKPQIIQTLSLLGIYIFMSIFMPINVGMRSGDSDSKFYLLWIPYSIIGIEAFNNITRLFFNKKNIFSFIGKETMPYYCMHMCVIEFTNIWCYNYNFSNWYHFGLLVVSNVIILPIFTYLIKASRYKFILG